MLLSSVSKICAFMCFEQCMQDPAQQGPASAESQRQSSESTTELLAGMPRQGNLQPLAKRVRTTNYGNPLAVWKTAMDIAAEPSRPLPQGSAAPARHCVIQDDRPVVGMSQQKAILPQEQPESVGQARQMGCHSKATAATRADTASQPLRQPLLTTNCRANCRMSSPLAGNNLSCCWGALPGKAKLLGCVVAGCSSPVAARQCLACLTCPTFEQPIVLGTKHRSDTYNLVT